HGLLPVRRHEAHRSLVREPVLRGLGYHERKVVLLDVRPCENAGQSRVLSDGYPEKGPYLPRPQGATDRVDVLVDLQRDTLVVGIQECEPVQRRRDDDLAAVAGRPTVVAVRTARPAEERLN